MNAMWSEARARVSHKLATHVRVEPFRLCNETPIVSFTFDDIPKSAVTAGARILEEHGVTGTFYIVGNMVGADQPEWTMADAGDIAALHSRGHEIGCHTFTHRRACDLDAASMTAEIEQNRQYLCSLSPSINPRNFAYPYGYGSIGRKQQLAETFQSCRSIVRGVNNGETDLQFLKAMPLIDCETDRDEIERAFDAAESTNGWLIFYSHDVADDPSRYGCSPALLNHALEAASRRNIPVLNMAEALQCAGA